MSLIAVRAVNDFAVAYELTSGALEVPCFPTVDVVVATVVGRTVDLHVAAGERLAVEFGRLLRSARGAFELDKAEFTGVSSRCCRLTST